MHLFNVPIQEHLMWFGSHNLDTACTDVLMYLSRFPLEKEEMPPKFGPPDMAI